MFLDHDKESVGALQRDAGRKTNFSEKILTPRGSEANARHPVVGNKEKRFHS